MATAPLYVFTEIIKQLHLGHKILYNIVKHLLSNRIISIDFVSSKDNLANPFTKDLSGGRINYASGE